MGWKSTVRSMNAASNRAQRESDRQTRAVHREHDSMARNIQRDAEAVRRRLRAFMDKVERDPVSALHLSYSASKGIHMDAFELGGEYIKGTVRLTEEGDGGKARFSPERADEAGFSVQPLAFLDTPEFCAIAVRVEGRDPAYRIKLNWLKKSDRSESPAYLTDPNSERYYYPVASTLSGEVAPNAPKTGIIAFERIETPTDRLTLHVSDVKLTSERGKRYTFQFGITVDGLRNAVNLRRNAKPLRQQVDEQIDAAVETMLASVEESRKKNLGCLVVLVAIPAASLLSWGAIQLVTASI